MRLPRHAIDGHVDFRLRIADADTEPAIVGSYEMYDVVLLTRDVQCHSLAGVLRLVLYPV